SIKIPDKSFWCSRGASFQAELGPRNLSPVGLHICHDRPVCHLGDCSKSIPRGGGLVAHRLKAAEKNHVYPFDDRGAARRAVPKPSPGGADPNRSKFSYYVGASRLPETAAAAKTGEAEAELQRREIARCGVGIGHRRASVRADAERVDAEAARHRIGNTGTAD